MGAKKAAFLCGYYDPHVFDRRMLPPDHRLEVAVRAPRGTIVPKCNLVPPLVAMCRAAGVMVTEEDFLKYRMRRPVLNGRIPTQYEVRRVRSGQLYVMYEDVRHGLMHPLFVEILAAAGWQQFPATVVVHRPLPMSPRKKHVPDPAQFSLNFT